MIPGCCRFLFNTAVLTQLISRYFLCSFSMTGCLYYCILNLEGFLQGGANLREIFAFAISPMQPKWLAEAGGGGVGKE